MISHFLGRFPVKKAHHNNGSKGKNETRDDFIKARGGKEIFPDKDGRPADNNSCQGTLCCHTAPVKGKNDQRSKGRTKAGPGLGHNGENHAVWIQGKDQGQDGDNNNHNTAYHDKFLRRSLLMDENLIEIRRKA